MEMFTCAFHGKVWIYCTFSELDSWGLKDSIKDSGRTDPVAVHSQQCDQMIIQASG